ncbi:unnamed protein product [Closterium sp. Naga37s-1]|nr:unnamed protein product [Closterium sp. Naga37s-1]
MPDLLLPPPYPPLNSSGAGGCAGAGSWCWRLALGLVPGAGGWRWGWFLVLATGAGTCSWCWRLALGLVPGAGGWRWGWFLVLAAGAGAGSWCWRLALGLVPGAGGWCWGWFLVLAAGAGAGSWCWRLALGLVPGAVAGGAQRGRDGEGQGRVAYGRWAGCELAGASVGPPPFSPFLPPPHRDRLCNRAGPGRVGKRWRGRELTTGGGGCCLRSRRGWRWSAMTEGRDDQRAGRRDLRQRACDEEATRGSACGRTRWQAAGDFAGIIAGAWATSSLAGPAAGPSARLLALSSAEPTAGLSAGLHAGPSALSLVRSWRARWRAFLVMRGRRAENGKMLTRRANGRAIASTNGGPI